jgi:hypothetical protein
LTDLAKSGRQACAKKRPKMRQNIMVKRYMSGQGRQMRPTEMQTDTSHSKVNHAPRNSDDQTDPVRGRAFFQPINAS